MTYRIYVLFDGCEIPVITAHCFDDLLKATTFAGIETAAGMGEKHIVVKED